MKDLPKLKLGFLLRPRLGLHLVDLPGQPSVESFSIMSMSLFRTLGLHG